MNVIAPIHEKRMMLESRIDDTWEMLCAQSAKAAARAEQTMQSVRAILDLSHDLGSVRRFFGATDDDVRNAHDLSGFAEWTKLPQDERNRELREYWRNNLVPREVALSQEGNRVFKSLERELEEPFLSAKKKRVFVAAATAAEEPESVGAKSELWTFEIPAKSFEVWTLLCWRKQDNWLLDFVIPQKFFSQPFAKAKKPLKKDEKVPVSVRKEEERYLLSFAGGESVDITELQSSYEPLG